MAKTFSLNSEGTMFESITDMPVLRDIINDLRESVASCAQTSNSCLPTDDLLIKRALALPSVLEADLSSDETETADKIDIPNENTSYTILDALVSSGKRISIALNSTGPLVNIETSEQIITSSTIQQVSSRKFDDASSATTASSAPTKTSLKSSRKQRHIMISYNRSCEMTCRQIRNSLKNLKYKVWMDVYDMHDNFIDGMAKAIKNSYIVLMCINRQYDNSFWCRKEAEDVAIKRIKFIPCFMEKPYPLEDWLDFLVGGNIWIDFSIEEKFGESFQQLIQEITFVEKQLETYPRETPPVTPHDDALHAPLVNPTVAAFDSILGNFKTWIEDNRHNLKRFNRKQSIQLISQLVEALDSDTSHLPDDENKKELLQQLLLSTSRDPYRGFSRLINNSFSSNRPMINGLLFIMAFWAVRVVFQKN